MRFRYFYSQAFIAMTTSSFLIGCSSYKNIDDTAQYAAVSEKGISFSQGGRIIESQPVGLWWEQFNDDTLSTLIERSLTKNHDIQLALSSINESRALLRRSQLEWAPSLTSRVGASRQKLSADELPSGSDRFSESFNAGFDMSWELDIFGRLGHQVDLSQAQLRAREANFDSVKISVAAEVAKVYVSYRGSQYLLLVANDSVKNQTKTWRMAQRYAEVGRGDNFAVQRAKTQLELTAAGIPALQAELHIAINRLHVLTGEPVPGLNTALAESKMLPSLPTKVAVGDALGLLKRRPDILQAEQTLRGAMAEYNVRVADLYPRVSLTGSVGYLSSDWSRLGEEPTETFRFSPTLHWAAFDLTRVNAQINAADARTQGRIAEFEKTVLMALEETDNAMVLFSREEERRLRLREAARASAQAAQFAQSKFEIGTGDFRDVLDAEQIELNAKANLVNSETQLLLHLVSLYKALGGWGV